MALKALVREPLVHFVAIGALIFAIDRARGSEPERAAKPVTTTTVSAGSGSSGPGKRIVIDAAARELRRVDAERRLGHPPNDVELAAEIERWIEEEVLYREAIARGLDGEDPVIHQRIADRMSFVLERSLAPAEPTDAELRAYFDAHAERWATPERIDFTHVFVGGTDAAAILRMDEIERTVARGQPPDRLGDTFTGGRRYRGRKPADLVLVFGESFVGEGPTALAAQPANTWVRRTSKLGLHLVRVERAEAGQSANFEAAKLDVKKAWLEERRARDLAAATKRLRDAWEVVRE